MWLPNFLERKDVEISREEQSWKEKRNIAENWIPVASLTVADIVDSHIQN